MTTAPASPGDRLSVAGNDVVVLPATRAEHHQHLRSWPVQVEELRDGDLLEVGR